MNHSPTVAGDMSLVTRETSLSNGQKRTRNQINGNGDLRLSDPQSPGSEADNNSQIVPRNGPFSEEDLSREYNAPPSSFSIPKQNGGGMQDRGAGGLVDFFSPEVFQIVLHNPTTAHRLLKFSQARMCGENMEFLEKVFMAQKPMREAFSLIVDSA